MYFNTLRQYTTGETYVDTQNQEMVKARQSSQDGLGEDSLLVERPCPPEGLVVRGVGELPPLLPLHRLGVPRHLSRCGETLYGKYNRPSLWQPCCLPSSSWKFSISSK